MTKIKRNRKPTYTPEQVTIAVHKVGELLTAGNGIIMSVKKACGSNGNQLAKAVRATDLYLFMLNNYYQKRYNKNFEFQRIDKFIKPTKTL